MKREQRRPRAGRRDQPATFDTVRAIARDLPGAIEGTSYGTPAFRAGKHLFVRLHDNGEWLVVRIEPDHRTMRMAADPETFFITDHYRDTTWMLVRLASVDPDDLRDLLEEAWSLVARKRLRTGPATAP